MKGLLKNNYFAVRSNAKAFSVFMLLLGIFVVAVISPSLLMGYALLGMIGFSLNAIAGLRKESSTKWSKYKLTAPVKRSDIVKSYFISQILWLIVGIAYAGIGVALSIMLHGVTLDRNVDIFMLFVVGIGISLFMGAIFFPLFYLGGEERNEVFLIISLLCGIGIVMGLSTLINTLFPKMTAPQLICGGIAILACSLLVYVLSYPLTVAMLIIVVFAGLLLSALLICRQNSAEHIKGRVPRRGIYITTILAKGVFVGFIIFFLSIAVRNAAISYHTMQTSQFLADKMAGYVTVPVNTSNASTQNLAENYKAFYSATVNRYNGILVDTSNYEYDLISGRTLAEEFGQTSITVNRNYLDFNPIYDVSGRQITSTQLSDTRFNVLLPTSREQEKESWSEFVQTAYGMEANFIPYDGTASKICSYNANTGTGNYGAIDEPVILVIEEEQIEGIFVLSYYFLHQPQRVIGAYFGQTRSTAGRHIQLALRRLREEMEVSRHE